MRSLLSNSYALQFTVTYLQAMQRLTTTARNRNTYVYSALALALVFARHMGCIQVLQALVK